MQYTNLLAHETSPYLLQHAHNPVNWYPWGEEALNKARAEDKPILVSIGYSACHWCHVMERESFESEAVATIMNERFINIKIDREERPDLDHIYMDAVQAMTGSGGWPLNVFLTPEGKPFYGGTYFPPRRAHNRASWTEVLEGVHKAYTENRDKIEDQAEQLTKHIEQTNAFGRTVGVQSEQDHALLQQIADNILKNADTEWGGFGAAPKFPQTFSIIYLLRHYHFSGQQEALDQALLSLDKMIDGGIYDQLGGGFARYSTDPEWLAPHFEKMLYDNALLVNAMSEAFQLTGNKKYERAIRETIGFVKRELTSPEKGFYSAIDADSEGVEGKFYTWQQSEIEALLGSDAPVFCRYYDISEAGNWEHTNILRVKKDPENFALQENRDINDINRILETGRKKLLEARELRPRPLLDDKQLCGWNALMITALAKAYAALGDPEYRSMAVSATGFLEKEFRRADGSWLHTFKQGHARIPAFLDDLAFLVQAYIHLQEITGNQEYLLKARELVEYLNLHFSEQDTGFYYYTHDGQQDVIVRKKEIYDGATPSANAVMASNILYISKIFNVFEWEERARQMIASLQKTIVGYPGSFGVWAASLQQLVNGTVEIAIVGAGAADHLSVVLRQFIPNKVIQASVKEQPEFPLLAGKKPAENGETRFYLCRDYACSDPLTDVVDFLAKV
ncbi:thioredoxin domain-containing protein [Sediminibacterium ginsengisoli]|uniref:Spermatogenesis-associated protein 20-like TRX domain-containing protein n=1 Tax=Sediminibacterium ginsengisoli TaxID=413434 RepID=A0A1T4JVI0_9BACT|nr:thioredoxin domain-containing protein [Sediminibacterium ginsengisoli]SJZ34242.1 hypothetical protein SAMN04488132_101234 [Sediminibacterium ginsengisoli]